jgi:YihY family inner membrane protein
MMADLDKSNIRQFIKKVGRLFFEKHLFFNASAITFNLFLCAIPFTLIITSILGYVLSVDTAFDELIRYGRELFPSFSYVSQSGDIIEGVETLEALIEPLIGARQIFGIAGLIILVFFAQGLFHTLKHVIFDVFDIQDRKGPAMELIYNFFAFGGIGSVFLFFTMAISLLTLFPFNDYQIPYTDIVIEFSWLTEWLTGVVPLVFTFFLFYAIYRFVSERRIHPKVALVSAVFYTLMFEAAKIGFSIYLEYAFTAYRFFYQGYTVLIIISLWAFYSAALFVITTIIARAYRDTFLQQAPAIEKNPYTAIS